MDPPETATAGGTVTFLFTDIEGSTRLLQRLGEDYRSLLSLHHAILREAIAAAGGRVIDTAGDGFFAAFGRARDGVSAAAAIQRGVTAAPWPGGVDVAVRVGLHTGEPTVSAEGYVGLDVHRAARIADAAAGGQVLLSRITGELAEADLPEGVELVDLGMHRLKDLHEPEHLVQLSIEGLRADFPPPRGLESRRRGFPAATTRLIGREAEVRDLASLLRTPGVRLVTLTGPGGTGKTRLALAAADATADAFMDGACFVSLAVLTDAQLVPAAILRGLGLRESPMRATLDVVAEHLRDQETLLVLDNFEQVHDAAPSLASLLGTCPRLSLLVTSRVVLRLSGEHEVPVDPLSLPGPSLPDTAAALGTNPAVALFVERARAVRPDFVMDDEVAPAVAELCIRLDGLPLALELAASRIRVFSPHALLARLGRRLDLLRGGALDLPARHRTLRGAIQWSYDLLAPDQRALFRRLAAFVGGFTLEAAEDVASAPGPLGLDIVEGVGALVEHSLLRRDTEVHGEPRFQMLDTVREFGIECLEAAGEADRAAAAQARHLLDFARAVSPRLTGPDQRRWLDRLAVEQDNLRAALDRLRSDDVRAALELAVALYRFWIVRGQMRTGRRVLEDLLAAPGAHAATSERARALDALGTITHEMSEYGVARALLEESLAIFRDLGDDAGVAATSTSLSWVAVMVGDFDTAVPLGEEALALHRHLGQRRGQALALANLGIASFLHGSSAEGIARLEQARGILDELGDRRGVAYQSINLAWCERHQGRWAEAATRIDDALVTLAMLRDDQLTAWGLTQRGALAAHLGEPDQAVRALEQALDQWREVGNRWGAAECLGYLAEARLALGDHARADALSVEGLTQCDIIGASLARAFGLTSRGSVLARMEDPRAGAVLAEGLSLSVELGLPYVTLQALEGAALVAQPLDAGAAAAFLGAWDALSARIGFVAPVASRQVRARLDAVLRRTLGDAETDAALAEGAEAPLAGLADRLASTLRTAARPT
jgi:predicted ATPase/class 3 adenylate cyclase